MADIAVAMDVHVAQADPAASYGDLPQLHVRGSGTSQERQAFLFFPSPVPAGATVITATLTLTPVKTGWAGEQVTAKRITAGWSTPTWNDRPAVTDTNAASAIGSGSTPIALNVAAMLGDVAGGADWYGVRLELDTDILRQVASKEASAEANRPKLSVVYSTPPPAPIDLHPSNGLAVSPAAPALSWTPQGEHTAFLVQVADDEDSFATPLWDSGWVVSTETQITSGHSLANLESVAWRVKTRNSAGLESPYSEAAAFSRLIQDTLTVEVS